MRPVYALGALALCLASCVQEAPPPPAVPAMPEDLSAWTVPVLVQPVPALHEDMPVVPVDPTPTPAEKVYAYAVGTPVVVQVPVGWPLDVLLEPGEQVRNIVGGDRPPQDAPPAKPQPGETLAPEPTRRWEVREGVEGQGETQRPHIFLSASEVGMTTGVIVTTSRRTYYLTCQSVKASPIRVLRWTYPARMPVRPVKASEPGILPDPDAPRRYHVGYRVEATSGSPEWLPRVYDDGTKLYLLYPEVSLFDTVPMVRTVGPNGAAVTNVRQYLNVAILDHLAGRLELRVGIGDTAEVVTVTREALHTIACPGDSACPDWPAAARTLTGRSLP